VKTGDTDEQDNEQEADEGVSSGVETRGSWEVKCRWQRQTGADEGLWHHLYIDRFKLLFYVIIQSIYS